MGVYIKDMEMPKSCAGCFNRCCGLWREVALPAHQRHKYCPVIPVPPHGSLIDLDAIPKEAWRGEKDDLVDELILAPIIIPAEEGKT